MERPLHRDDPTIGNRSLHRLGAVFVAALALAAATAVLVESVGLIIAADRVDTGNTAVAHAQADHRPIYLPALRRRWPMTVCDGAMSTDEAVERARNRAEFEGLGPPPGEARPHVEAADRLTALEYDAAFADIDEFALLEGHFPVPAPWECYWRVDLSGDGMFQGSRPGSAPWRVNRFLTVFSDKDDCQGCVGYWSIEWRDDPDATATPSDAEPTAEPTAEATPTARTP